MKYHQKIEVENFDDCKLPSLLMSLESKNLIFQKSKSLDVLGAFKRWGFDI